MPKSEFEGRYLSCYFRPKGASTRSKQIKWFGRVVSRNKPLDVYEVIWAIGSQNLTDARKILDDDDNERTKERIIRNYVGLKELGTYLIPLQGDIVHWENSDEGAFIGKVIDDPQNLRHLQNDSVTINGDDEYLFD